MDDHTPAVDIGTLQGSQLGAPCPCGIERHQYDAMKPSPRGVDEEGNFFWAQYARKVLRLLGIGCIGHAPSLLNRLDEEEAQRQPLCDSVSGEFPLTEQTRPTLTDVLRAELSGGRLK